MEAEKERGGEAKEGQWKGERGERGERGHTGEGRGGKHSNFCRTLSPSVCILHHVLL